MKPSHGSATPALGVTVGPPPHDTSALFLFIFTEISQGHLRASEKHFQYFNCKQSQRFIHKHSKCPGEAVRRSARDFPLTITVLDFLCSSLPAGVVPTGAAHERSIPPTRHISDHDHTENSLEFMDERRNFKNASTSLRLKPAKVAVPFSKGKEGHVQLGLG